MLETLRPQERVNQVCAYRGGDDGCNDVFHGGFLEVIATAHVRPGDQEKQNRDDDEEQIEHV